MTRRFLAIGVACGLSCALVFACLPELSALKGTTAGDAGDAGEEAATSAACGDGFIDEDAGEQCDPGESVTTTCPSCRIQCQGTLEEGTKHCYYVASNAPVTRAEALTLCSAGHLVTIDNELEATFVDALAKGAPYWVGLELAEGIGYRPAVPSEPGFSTDAGCTGCFVRSLATGDGGACVVSNDGGWTLSSCTETAATICETEPVGSRSFYCQGPYCSTVSVTAASKRYLLYLENAARTASEAAAECARYEGGRLVVFDSAQERELLVQEIVRLGVLTPFTAWVGIASDGGTWAWDDGKPVDDGGRASPWGGGQPNTNAGRAFIRIGPAFFDSQLAQTGDDIARPFICERK